MSCTNSFLKIWRKNVHTWFVLLHVSLFRSGQAETDYFVLRTCSINFKLSHQTGVGCRLYQPILSKHYPHFLSIFTLRFRFCHELIISVSSACFEMITHCLWCRVAATKDKWVINLKILDSRLSQAGAWIYYLFLNVCNSDAHSLSYIFPQLCKQSNVLFFYLSVWHFKDISDHTFPFNQDEDSSLSLLLLKHGELWAPEENCTGAVCELKEVLPWTFLTHCNYQMSFLCQDWMVPFYFSKSSYNINFFFHCLWFERCIKVCRALIYAQSGLFNT